MLLRELWLKIDQITVTKKNVNSQIDFTDVVLILMKCQPNTVSKIVKKIM